MQGQTVCMPPSKTETALPAIIRLLDVHAFDNVMSLAGDLGAIDAKYDIAVSTSCAALDYVVVDNTATAQCCVEMLRRRGLGVATFLILDKQQHLARALQEKPTPPEGKNLTASLSAASELEGLSAICAVSWQVPAGPLVKINVAVLLF